MGPMVGGRSLTVPDNAVAGRWFRSFYLFVRAHH
jgi:hypothetical protein